MTESSHPNKVKWLAFILLFLAGVAMRLVQFLRRASLSVDEASMSLNIINRSHLALLHPLAYHQEAPVGFLWASRFLVNLFGPNEFALRGYSLICGIASLPVFFLVARRLYRAKIAWLALGLLAFLPSMVRYSNEARPYMGDVLWSGLLILATQNASNGTGIRRWLILFTTGAFSFFFSYPALFVLAGCLSYLVLSALSRPAPWKTFVPLVLVGVAWLAFSCIDYILLSRNGQAEAPPPGVTLAGPFAALHYCRALATFALAQAQNFCQKLTADANLVNYWSTGHAPIPPRSWVDLQWYGWALWRFVYIAMGFAKLQWVMMTAITIGVLAVAVRRKLEETMLLFPVGFALLASSWSIYPFVDRWILWLVPFAVLVICAGVDQLSRIPSRRLQRPACVLATAGLFFYPLYATLNLTFRDPCKIEEIRHALRYLDNQESPAELVYYNPGAESLLDFYIQSQSWRYLKRMERRPLQMPDSDSLALPADAHGKVWIVLAHAPNPQAVNRLIRNIGDRGRVIQRWHGAGAMAMIVTCAAVTNQTLPILPTYPLKVSANGRYLTDQNNTPFLIVGDTAWSLITQVSNSDVEIYLADRASRGFNVLWVAAVDNSTQSNPPCNYYGDPPFDGADFTHENAAYWAHVDYVISRAAAYGITIMLSPGFVGLDSADGYLKSYQNSSHAVMTAYGTFLGNRYKSYPNIIWVLGGDADPAQTSIYIKLSELAAGIKSVDTVHLMTFEASRWTSGNPAPGGGYSSLDVWSGPPFWLDLNWVYLMPTSIPSGVASNYSRSPWLPPFLGEDYYELEHSMTAFQVRQEGYWAILSGATLGRIFGNHAIWTFNSPNAEAAGDPTWQNQLGSAGSVEQSILGALFRSRGHWKLLPDINHTVMTAGYQSGSTLAATARTSDGDTVISYIPTQRRVTINMTKISDPQANAWWFNPRAGTSTRIGTFGTTGPQDFTPPDQNDWVLVIDGAALNLAAPGTQRYSYDGVSRESLVRF
jgi:hypothetical protein